MIDFAALPLDIPHGVVVIGDAPGADSSDVVGADTSNLSPLPAEASTTALKIHVSDPNNPYDGTVFDKDLWLNAPHPDDGDKVCEWAKDMAAAQPKAACDQWSSEDWDAWADEYGDNDCDIPKCGESFPARLEPFYQQHTGDPYLSTIGNNAKSQLALPVIPEGVERPKTAKLNLLEISKPSLRSAGVCAEDFDEAEPEPETPRKRYAKMHLPTNIEEASRPAVLPSLGAEDEDASIEMTPRTWDMVQKTRASPGHIVLSCHAMTLAAVQTSLKGGGVASFKEDALANAGAITPVGKALLEAHVFKEEAAPEASGLPRDGVVYNFDVFYDTPKEGEIYAF